MKILSFVAAFLFAVLVAPLASADTVTIDFENLSDSTIIGSNYAPLGVVFSGAAIATAGISLNEADFPPNSGTNVAVDALGPITLSFTTEITSFSGFFTYASGLTVTAFNGSDQVLGSVSSAFSQNTVSSGNTPNELLQLGGIGTIDHITITGNPGGSSFAMDDITYIQSQSVQVAEPGTFILVVLGTFLLVFWAAGATRTQELRNLELNRGSVDEMK